MAKKEIFEDDLDNVVGGNAAAPAAPVEHVVTNLDPNSYANDNRGGKQAVSQQGDNNVNTITQSEIVTGDGIIQSNQVSDNTGDVKIGGNFAISNAGTGNNFNFS